MKKLEEDPAYDPSDWTAAMGKSLLWGEEIPIGKFFERTDVLTVCRLTAELVPRCQLAHWVGECAYDELVGGEHARMLPTLSQLSTFALGFAAGILAAVFASYLSWLFELRKRAFDSLVGFYEAFLAACTAVLAFYGQTGGIARVSLGYDPLHPDRAEVRAYWETRGKLLELQIQLSRVAIFLTPEETTTVLDKWESLWKGFHKTGENAANDLVFTQAMPDICKDIAALLRKKLMTFRGFVKAISH